VIDTQIPTSVIKMMIANKKPTNDDDVVVVVVVVVVHRRVVVAVVVVVVVKHEVLPCDSARVFPPKGRLKRCTNFWSYL
jgi:hypothetical protein